MSDEKNRIRREMLARRDALSATEVSAAGERWTAALLAASLWRTARQPALYVSFGNELPTGPLLARLWSEGRAVVLPRVVGCTLTLHRVAGRSELVPGKFGILEPSPEAPRVTPVELDLIVVPGVAFDLAGNRIGFGKGYYDRLLADASAPTLGAAYDCQVLPSVPAETHDRRMRFLLTPTRLLSCADDGIAE